jgi:iron complex outermembrane receptor protein
MNNKRILVSLFAIASTIAMTPAVAQVEEIVVTARKKAENLQEVPISISAYSAKLLEDAGIQDINDLANFTSNMTFSESESGRINTPTIRGMSMIDTRGFDNNVSVFIDGVFVSGRAAQNQGMLDLERVEVVKGPQSALYGRNSFAGAINYVTKRPGDEFEGKAELTVGEYDLYELLGSVSGPLVENKLAGRVVASYDDDGGTYNNIPGGDIGGHKNQRIMGTLRWTPNDALDISLDAYYADEEMDQLPLTIDPNNCGVLPITNSSASYQAGFPYWHCGEVKGTSSDNLNISPPAFASKSDTKRLSLNIEWDLGDYTVTSISAYTENDSYGMTDLDRTDRGAEHYGYITKEEYDDIIFILPGIIAPGVWGGPPLNHPDITDFEADTYIGSQGLDQEYASQELRIESSPDERFRWSAGAFYFKSTNTQTASFNVDVSEAIAMSGLSPEELVFVISDPESTAFPGGIGVVHPVLDQQWETSTPIWTDGTIENNRITEAIEKARQYALFGSVEYDFSDQLTGTVELRYTEEKRSLHDRKDAFFGSLDAYGPGGSYNRVEHEYLDPRFTLAYQINDDHMVYGSASKGTRSGGINGNLAPDVDPFYDPEKNWTYEIGSKNTLLDGKLILNAAAFYIDWEDAQFRQLIAETLLTKVSNSTGIEVLGAEFDFVYSPVDDWLISGGYGYSDAEFDDGTIWTGGTRLCQGTEDNGGTPAFDDCVPPPGDPILDSRYENNITTYPNMSGLRPKRSSEHTANLAVEYSRPAFADIDGFVRVDASYRSKQYVDEANSAWVPDRTLVNLRTGFQSDKYDLIFWVTNLFEEDAPVFAQQFGTDFNNFNTTSSAVNIPLHRFGVTGRYRF